MARAREGDVIGGTGGLEVLRRPARRPSGLPPVLLVHGAWHGAWCWDRGFMDRLADRGHDVAAVSLRGHGGSEGKEAIAMRSHGIGGYVDDVARAAETFDEDPVVVGHSMGGFVVQRYLSERRRARAGVLMASVPPGGVLPLLMRLLRADPIGVARVHATLSCRPVAGDVERAHRLFFSAGMPRAEVQRHFGLMGDESFTAFLQLLRPRLDPSAVRVPTLVMEAGADAIFTRAEARATAGAYGSSSMCFQGMAHDMMLEAGWERVADALSLWCAPGVESRMPKAA